MAGSLNGGIEDPWTPRAGPSERPQTCAKLFVRALSRASRQGRLQFGPFSVPCALGLGGIKVLKREGDGATPTRPVCGALCASIGRTRRLAHGARCFAIHPE